MGFIEGAKNAASKAVKAKQAVAKIMKFFGTIIGQIVMWVLIILLAIILLYILVNTVSKALASILGIENPGLRESTDYQILLELQNSGYNTLMDSKELQEYTAYEYNVLMDIARYMEEKGVYVDESDPARFDENIYNTEEYRKALAERRAAGLASGFEKVSNEDFDNMALENWKKATGSKAQRIDNDNPDDETEEEASQTSSAIEDNLSNEEVKKELYYKLVDNGYGDTTEKALVPYLRLERGAYRNTYYLLDKSTTNNLLNENGEINTSEVEKLEKALDSVEGVTDSSALSGTLSDLAARMENIDGYYLNAELNKNMLSKSLTRNMGFGEELSLTKEYKHEQLYYDRVDAGSCTYDIPLKVIVDRFLPKATLLSSWYMLKGEDKDDKEKGPAGKVLEQIRAIYDEACLGGETAKEIIVKEENRDEKQKAEDETTGDKVIIDYTNNYTSLIMQRAYLDISEQYPWYFDEVKTIKPITDLVCGIDLSKIYEIGASATTGDNNEKLLDSNGKELNSNLSYGEIARILSEEYVLKSGERVRLVKVQGEGYVRDIPDGSGTVEYPDIKDDEKSIDVSDYYYAMKDGEKILITAADLNDDDGKEGIISQIERKIIATVKANLSRESKIPQKDIKVRIGTVNITSPEAVFTCEEVKFPISQLVLRRNLPTYFPKEAKTWSREVTFDNNIKYGPKFLDNSTLCLIPNCNEYGYQQMSIKNDSKWRTKLYAPVFPTVRENDVIAMFSEWENSTDDGVYAANCYIRDLYKLIEYSKQEKDKNGKAYVDEESYTYVNISDEILLFNENTIDQMYWLNHLLATEEDPILPEETLTMRTKMDVMSWQNVEYELYEECHDEETNTYKVYALWPLGNYISRARYATLANATKDGQDYTEVWGGYQYNNRHAGVDLYGRRIVGHMKDAYKDGFDQDLLIDDSKVRNTETQIVMDGRTEIFKDADSAVYAYELYRLSKASGSNDNQAAKVQLDSIVDKLSKDTPIVAVAPGIVTNVHGGPVCGFRVKIEHTADKDCKTLYVHMKRWPNVQVGQYVGAGTVIGYEGTTGKSGAVHLHFEITVGGHRQIYPIPYLYPMFSPFYNEEKAEEAEYGLESEYMSLVRTVYPVGQIIGEGVVTSPETKGVDQSVKQRRFVYLPDGTAQQTQIQQVEEEDGKVKIKNYVPSYPIADNYLKLYTYSQHRLTDGVEENLSESNKTDGSSYNEQEFVEDLYYDRDFIKYFKYLGTHVVVGDL